MYTTLRLLRGDGGGTSWASQIASTGDAAMVTAVAKDNSLLSIPRVMCSSLVELAGPASTGTNATFTPRLVSQQTLGKPLATLRCRALPCSQCGWLSSSPNHLLAESMKPALHGYAGSQVIHSV